MPKKKDRLEAAFAREEARAQATSAPVMLVAIALITVWITWENGFPNVLFFYPFMLGFAALGLAPVLLPRLGWQPWWERYARFGFGVVLLVGMIMFPNPFSVEFQTPAMRLRWQNEVYLYVLVVATVFSYSPRVVLWTGAVAASAWLAAAAWIMSLPQTHRQLPAEVWKTMTVEQQRAEVTDPNFVFVNGLLRNTIVLLVVSGTLSIFVRRSREVVRRYAQAERQRDNLSRYFSANVVDELAEADTPLSVTRRQDIAVLFADIVGFTTMSANEPPEAVIETLRQFHQRTESAVFAHDGTLEKYIGDGVMATFGTPRPGPADAANSLRCAAALLSSVEQWNRERIAAGRKPIAIGIGVHFGAVVLGDIGGEQRLEFAVVGDTVNVANRLERLTRELGCVLVVSGDLVDAVQREGWSATGIVPGLSEIPSRAVRGRSDPLRLWVRAGGVEPHLGVP